MLEKKNEIYIGLKILWTLHDQTRSTWKTISSGKEFNKELIGKLYFQLYGLETVCLRYFNVFGKNQDPTSEYSAVIPKFIKKIYENERPEIYGDGTQSRDFT
ncbi:MAG: NAD-dependent epimerase/dehydratase family protein [Clostridiales bacterium]|nr:NAD-dependent epimerase/dehydratase family protein [Clostridiales bacterium]